MKKSVILLIAFAVAITILGTVSVRATAYNSQCAKAGCTRKRSTGSIYCYVHKSGSSSSGSYSGSSSSSSRSSYSSSKSTSKKSSYSGSSKKTYDSYGVHDYKSAQDFADDKYEEFYDYEDDFDDYDEAYDAAEDYWNDNY